MTAVVTLPIAPVDRRHLQFCQIDSVDAADVQRHHLGAVGLAAARKHIDAAVDAELMPDRVLVEQILLATILSCAQLKAVSPHQREMQNLLCADRAAAI